MNIRRADHSDIRRVAELWVHSFPGRRTLTERMHTLETGGSAGGIETVHVAVEGHALAGALKMLPFTQYFGGRSLSMMGLAAIAVAPDARRRGLAAALCTYALETAAAKGDALSVLFPFRPAFYERFGWVSAGTLHRYRFPPERLAPEDGPVRLAGSEDEPAIRACYDRVARASEGMIARGPVVWRRHLDAPSTFAWVCGEPRARGYLIARYGESRSTDTRPLIVRELMAEDDSTYRALLGWISRQRDLWRRVQYDALPDEHFDLRLSEPRPYGHAPARSLWAPVATVLRGPMLRIVDVKAALEGPADWAGEGEFSLDVRDELLPDNAGRFGIAWRDGAARVERGTGGGPVLSLDIATLARLFAGELTVTEALSCGAAIDGDAAPASAFFAARTGLRLLDVF